ncbi:molybdate ABC transporter substrate-binding protein [Marinimicrobium sp. ABcell2]|uniref:molybdate ABC transporter substrate-binding protein n=1 Tax=Marinimicrobium sp. ABcell2 TaxID=3069751 RepID=UPI0027B03FD0|nr:molybdate ABC transporter substrate-binding protein [Marinimicrobium sp. ABcell2]MDQ2075638.1 molybdate ABC transporter substrate-binding protein [Marinimicrobium sp. ABcell2]
MPHRPSGPLRRYSTLITALSVLLWASYGMGAELRIAVAANFNHTLRSLVEEYQTENPEFRASVSSASSGKHFAQIRQGAPFHVFFSADDQRTADLVASGDALAASRTPYALGQLVLWSSDPALIPEDGLGFLRSGEFNRLAIANPRVAPYGAAAEALLEDAGIELARGQRVTGQSIGQVFNFVSSGNADVGFIAASQVILHERRQPSGSRWQPPADSYPPIVQEVVLLKAGADHPWASDFLYWVVCDSKAHALIQTDGYLIPDDEARHVCTGNQ